MAKKHTGGNVIGSWAFLLGLIIAVILGSLGTIDQAIAFVLIILGLIIGIFNIADEKTEPFLMSGTVIVIVGYFGSEMIGRLSYIGPILQALTILFVPATIIIALKNVFAIAKN